MNKKLLSVAIGIALLLSPVIASAQTTTSNVGIIAILEQLVATLTQELQQLIGIRTNPMARIPTPTPISNGDLSASINSGPAPLSVTFSGSVPDTFAGLDFGDGSTPAAMQENYNCVIGHPNCTPPPLVVNQTYTYQSAGTYVAKLTGSSGNVLGTVTITVTGSKSIQPSAAIDQNSPTSPQAISGITFTADGGEKSNATSLSGSAPFEVTFSTNPTPPSTTWSDTPVSISFGDGTTGTSWAYGDPGMDMYHTYPSSGTYIANLLDANGTVLGSVTVTVN